MMLNCKQLSLFNIETTKAEIARYLLSRHRDVSVIFESSIIEMSETRHPIHTTFMPGL